MILRQFRHSSVLLQEVLSGLSPHPGGIYLDCTLGGGGHSEAILEQLQGDGLVIGLDQDPGALEAAGQRLRQYGSLFRPLQANFRNLDRVLQENQITLLDGALFDLGVSSPQLDVKERGFTFRENAPLDMRMDPSATLTATQLLADSSEAELRKIFYEYGEERWSARIAQFIVAERQKRPIESSDQLVEIIKAAVPASVRREDGNETRRIFQALRIAVNDELNALKIGLKKAIDALRPQGVIAVITFHSLEDRIVKDLFRELVNPCICPAKLPVCVCGRQPMLELVNTKPILPKAEELQENPRSHSAKLRLARRLATPIIDCKEDR
ncbi:MAG: 16S rRNA (cytosine(1402)-N(4))-methyltransferase RsmH [Negativicutes bacterium]|nr:16S rRNA (cytosine(1402)-N(4))-methyltransferase RsmH [Negativicutes bacterium]